MDVFVRRAGEIVSTFELIVRGKGVKLWAEFYPRSRFVTREFPGDDRIGVEGRLAAPGCAV